MAAPYIGVYVRPYYSNAAAATCCLSGVYVAGRLLAELCERRGKRKLERVDYLPVHELVDGFVLILSFAYQGLCIRGRRHT